MKDEDDERESLISSKINSYNTKDDQQRRSSPLEWIESSWTRWWRLLSWTWVYPMLSLSYKRPLTDNDLDDIPYNDKASVLFHRLHSYNWTSTTTTWKIVSRVFWKEFMLIGLFFLPYIAARIIQPLLLRQIMFTIKNQQESINNIAYLYAVLLSIGAVIQISLHQLFLFYSTRIGIRIRNALTLNMYVHSLSMKTTSLQKLNNAQIINFVSIETSKFEMVCRYLHYIWAGPLEGLITFGLLSWIIGFFPILCGYIVFLIFTFIQLIFSRLFRYQREITISCSDKRIHAFNEFIQGCHIIKMYNWEKLMEDRIHEMRQNELSSIQRASLLRSFNMIQFFVSIPLLSLTTFGSAWLLHYPLNSIDIFTAVSFFIMMRTSIAYMLPVTIERISEIQLASQRIDTLMRMMTIEKQESLIGNQQQKGTIIMSNATFSWNNNEPCLSSLNLMIETGTFVGIIGSVGSGKSSLLAAILSEMNLCNGQFNTNNSSFSYAAQSSWIFVDTLRNNILLNRPYNEERYRNIINVCCLDIDISLLGNSGDLTIIGERGINLSGGQKSRISLARALYTDADIYLLDDPLASVDRIVAKTIYERCIGPRGLLKNKTRLLVTHQIQFLIETDQIFVLSNGHISKKDHNDKNIFEENNITTNDKSNLKSMLDINSSIADTKPIITDETSAIGSVNWSIWYHLFIASPLGRCGLCLLIILFFIGEIFYDISNIWLSLWSRQSYINQQYLLIFPYVYLGLVLATVFADIFRINYAFSVMLHGSNNLHNNMLKGLLYTSIQFFESNPTGRILNRVSKDQDIIDDLLPGTLISGIESLLIVIGSVIIICIINPSILILCILLIPMFYFLTRFYLQANRRMKRLESVTRSPIYALFSSSFNGLSTIRAFKCKDFFIELITDKININTRVNIIMQGAAQWFSIIVDLISCFFMLITAILLIYFREHINPSIGALCLSYTIVITGRFPWSIRLFAESELLMTSAERINEYAQLLPEEDSQKKLVKTSPEWPDFGNIEFRNYSLRYRSDLEPVLKNINLRIDSGQKVGIIGRTGAGKSSLLTSLFRFLPQSNIEGEIFIDNIDISCITLDHLRSHLSIIPQQSILFNGTLRYNLDPFNHYTDEQCWMALEDVQLKQFVSNHSDGLQMMIAESGTNLSVGQCQLICIARAILKKTKILLIDEATANVDQQTDEIIQSIIANKFRDRTILIIAHRLNTVANCDQIIVLDKGVIVNFDIPENIIKHYQLPRDGPFLDFRLLPYIGNGHIATVVYSDFIYMNGLYNSENGTSHRARIPSTVNWQFKIHSKSSLYTLNVSSGMFIETHENDEIRIERRLFASQEYTELLINHVRLIRKTSKEHKIHVPIKVDEKLTSIDINLTVITRNPQYVLLYGKTREIENKKFQNETLPVYIYYTPLPIKGLELDENVKNQTFIFITSIDNNQSIAKQSFDYATIEQDADIILSSHISLWNNIWSNGHIEIEGNNELQRQINSAFYYILSSLPPLSTKSQLKQFYGLSPGTLSRGGRSREDYSGHSFWDTETWMFPSILLFYPTLAKEILSYRIALRDPAAYNAALFGYEGWRYPWESARTGVDVTPDCCPEGRLYEIHITGDISFAARQYISITNNKDWLLNEYGGELIYEIARFWSSRVIYNNQRKQYEILSVLPPDEDAEPYKNNSVYTNAIASLSIELADYISCITNKTIPSKWLDIASNLYFPFDNLTKTYLEYENFDLKHTIIKQADVILLGYPLMWTMNDEIKQNNLLIYEPLTRVDGPAMTWSMYSIGFNELSDFNKTDQLFQRSYQSYVRSPFNVWTETQSGVGTVNFITGIGGFLQSVLFGYGGIRIKLTQLEFKPYGHLPDQATKFIFHGIKYQGFILDLTIDSKIYEIFIRSQNNNNSIPLLYEHGERHGLLKVNDRLSFPVGTLIIIRRSVALCP